MSVTRRLAVSVLLVLCVADRAAAQVIYVLDQFEAATIRVVQPNSTDPSTRYLWNLYLGNGTGTTTLTTAQKHDGAKSIQSRLTSGKWQFQFYTYTEALPGWGNGWQFTRQFVTNPASWQTNRVNRMRFWIKLPTSTAPVGGGNHNFEIGTYIRCSTCVGAEDGGGHFYHHYDLMYTGEWHQIIVDTHPNHTRGDDGNAERGDRLHPTGEAAFTYFDLMTRFYLDFPYNVFTFPADIYIDGFELYEETRTENMQQVYSLNGVYVPSTNKVIVGWQRHKAEDTVKHEVRYSFSDIHTIGWAAATAAPAGVITPPGSLGYNGMSYTTTAINVAGKSQLYLAIKPQNSPLFRQIVIPLPGSGGLTPPAPPRNVRIIR